MDFLKNDFSQAKVGGKVWSCGYGDGVIKQIIYNRDYPLKVYFEKTGIEDSYTLKGKHALIDLYPTLFWSEIYFNIPERPKRMVKKKITIWAGINERGHIKNCWTDFKPNEESCEHMGLIMVELSKEIEIEE